MAKTETSQSLFEYAVLYHPNATKDRREAGETPKSTLLLEPKRVLATSAAQVAMLAAREIPAEYTDKLDDIEVVVRPF